jgi:phosphonate transport system substrate-binding protein
VTSWIFGTGPVRLGPDGEGPREELGRLLGEALGAPARVETVSSYADLLSRFAAGDVPIAWMPPALAVLAVDEHKATMAASLSRGGGARYCGALFVQQGAPWVVPEELRGKRVAWVDVTSCAGYLYPRLALRERAIDVEGFLSYSMSTAGGRPSVTGWHDELGGEAMRAILTTEAIPSDVICIAPSVATADREKIGRFLAELHKEPAAAPVLRVLFGAKGFEPTMPLRYARVREALRAEAHTVRPRG